MNLFLASAIFCSEVDRRAVAHLSRDGVARLRPYRNARCLNYRAIAPQIEPTNDAVTPNDLWRASCFNKY
jgi:hypothetical protein